MPVPIALAAALAARRQGASFPTFPARHHSSGPPTSSDRWPMGGVCVWGGREGRERERQWTPAALPETFLPTALSDAVKQARRQNGPRLVGRASSSRGLVGCRWLRPDPRSIYIQTRRPLTVRSPGGRPLLIPNRAQPCALDTPAALQVTGPLSLSLSAFFSPQKLLTRQTGKGYGEWRTSIDKNNEQFIIHTCATQLDARRAIIVRFIAPLGHFRDDM